MTLGIRDKMKMRNIGYFLLLAGFIVTGVLFFFSSMATYNIWDLHAIKVSALSPASTEAIKTEMSSMANDISAYYRMIFWPCLAMLIGGLILGRQKK